MQNKIKNVMVVADFSKASLNATKSAVRVCQRHRANLHILRVHQTEHLFPMAAMQAPLPLLSEELMQAEADKLEAYARAIEKYTGVSCVIHHVPGLLIDAVARKVAEVNCDMLVLSNAFRQRNVIFGNTARRIVKAVDCPVLVMPHSTVESFKRIVMPLRHVQGALDKLGLTYNMARKNKASVHVVGVFGKRNDYAYGEVKRMVSHAYGKLLRNEINSSYEVSFGKNMAGNVLAACKAASADLVVVSASATQSLRQVFFDDYIRDILNNPEVPVLCFPTQDRAQTGERFLFTHSMLA